MHYSKSISNFFSQEKKEEHYKDFITASTKDFNAYQFHNLNYFEKLRYSDDLDGYIEAIKTKYPDQTANQIILLEPQKDAFTARLGNKLQWFFGSFGTGTLLIFLMVIIPSYNERNHIELKQKEDLKDDDLSSILELLNPLGSTKATALLLNLNILTFVTMVLYGLNIISPTPKELLELGANRRSEVLQGEYWRLFTSIFLHGGLMHLIMNLFGLGLAGQILEPILKQYKLFFCFLLTGMAASLTSIYWHENIISVGASGAIFGLFGMILSFAIFKIFDQGLRGGMFIFISIYAGISLLFGLLGGIDNAAHIGGLISGFMLGAVLSFTNGNNLRKNSINY